MSFKLRPLSFFIILLVSFISISATKNTPVIKETYKCLPCGNECDNDNFTEPGQCPKCHMELVKKSTIKYKKILPSEICAYIKSHPGVVLLDVRTKEEFEGKADPNFGTLQNAINIPVQELESKLSTISNLKKKDIIVYCSHSHRSPQASYILGQNGFLHVTNMEGGMSVMKDKGCVK